MPIPHATTIWQRVCIAFAGFWGGLGIAMAALNAHLPARFLLPDGRVMIQHAIDMQMWHALAMLTLAVWGQRRFRLVAIGFGVGTTLFCIPVYLLAFRGPNIAFLAPTGGTITIVSWLALAVLALRRN